jgi:hypothetical protein
MPDDGLVSRLQRFFGGTGSGGRVSGDPTSSNGASSLHLRWQKPPSPALELSVELEITEPPQVDRLYFFALQGGFSNGTRAGAGHLGLQWHPDYPGSTAANWGGYHSTGGILDGSALAVPSTLKNANTGDFVWQPHRRYRLTIGPWQPGDGPGPGSWPGAITDVPTGERQELRRLYCDGPYLVDAVMWAEVFARCDHPPVSIRWSDPVAVLDDGLWVPEYVTTAYQSSADGGCDNTSSHADATGLVQSTNTTRATAPGTKLAVP